jgi:hypothetical protein
MIIKLLMLNLNLPLKVSGGIMMKKRNFSIIAALLVMTFVMATIGCPEPDDGKDKGGGATAVEGDWQSSGVEKITFQGNSFTRITGDTLDYKGSFSLSDDGAIYFNITQYSSNGGSSWLNYNQYIDQRIMSASGMTEAQWNALPAAQKQLLREQYSSIITTPPTTSSGAYKLILDGKQLVIEYTGITPRTVVYQKTGTSTVATALAGKWVIEGAPTVVVLDFSTNQLQLRRDITTYTYYTLETDGKIEIGTSPGVFTQDFCTSYTITGDTLTFTGGSSETWYPSTTFKKYVFPPYVAEPLIADQWTDGSITSSIREAWYSFPVTSGTTYRLWWNDSIYGDNTKTLDVKVSGYYSDGTSIASFTDTDTAWATAKSFTANKSDTVYVKVIPYSATGTPIGTFGIVYSTGITRPGVTFTPPANATPLTANVWADGEITSSEIEDWYSFPVTAGNTFYVWWNESGGTTGNGLKTLNVNVTAFYANGTSIFTNVASAWSSARSFTPTLDDTVYLRVTPATSGTAGTYGIVYSESDTKPNAPFVPPNLTTLTADTWANGNIPTSSGQQWFTFTATTTGSQYIHIKFGALNDLYVQVYDNTGTTVGVEKNIYSTDLNIDRPVTEGQVYYIRVRPYSNKSGAYQILFNTSSIPPIDLPSNAIALTENQWTEGNIATSTGSQWFTFTATTTGSQYIHIIFGTLSNLNVQLYDSNGVAVGSETNMTGSNRSTSGTLISDQQYYIRVQPSGSGSGFYQIAFNATSASPLFAPTSTTLTVGVWANGEIAAGGQEWFKFTATATPQYIHVIFDTLNDFNVRIYDSNGNTIGTPGNTNMYGSNRSTSRVVTSGQDYYIRVWPYGGSSAGSISGTYQIAFNTSTTAPAQ